MQEGQQHVFMAGVEGYSSGGSEVYVSLVEKIGSNLVYILYITTPTGK